MLSFFFLDTGEEFATFSREQLSRHCPDSSGIEAYWHARRRVAGERSFSSFARGWRFDIGLVTFSTDRQVLNSANWAAECNKRMRIDLPFFFFPTHPFRTLENLRCRVTSDDEHVMERDERLMRKVYEFVGGLIWFMKWEAKEERRAIYFLLAIKTNILLCTKTIQLCK